MPCTDGYGVGASSCCQGGRASVDAGEVSTHFSARGANAMFAPLAYRGHGVCLSLGFDPDAAFVHEVDLLLNDFLTVLGVLYWCAFEVEVFGINGLLVEELVEFGAQVLHPVVPLCACAVVAQRFDVNYSSNIGRPGTIVLPTYNLALVIDDEGAPTEGIDWRRFFREQIICPHVGSHHVHVIIKLPGAALNLKYLIAGGGMRIGGAVDYFGTGHGEGACIFGIGAFVGHHDAEAPDLGIDDGPERIQVAAIALNPPVQDVVRAD